ncbi:MAG TPA: pirin family protein [Rhodanobacteraceae bacterium]|nr:pirin family protein [Rhodanobacteraceae bacterium]
MAGPIEQRIHGRRHDLGDGFIVNRVLPSPEGRAVGPFVFMDHLGPVTLAAGQAFDVRPHPHIGLATVTYLWTGRVEHRDGLGHVQVIEPGAVNWMTAGRGIVHSERTPAADRACARTMHGLQLWAALPLDRERCEPAFEHTGAEALPTFDVDGATLRVVAGHAYGRRSPVTVAGDLFYVDASLAADAELALPTEHVQRAAYVIDGDLRVGAEPLRAGELVIFTPGTDVRLRAGAATHVVLLGGAPLDAPRFLWWNYVASSEDGLAEARAAWRERRYAMVAGDPESIPLPDPGREAVRMDAG